MQKTQGSIPGLGRFPAEGNGNPLQYSRLGNPTDRRKREATVYEPAEEFNMTQQLTTGEQPSVPQAYGREKALCDQRARETMSKGHL